MRSEERRALVLLGITAILASFYAAMLGTIWSSNGKINETNFYFNLPAVSSPTRHTTFIWPLILQYMIVFWMIYAFFIFWYFSADWLSLRVRRVCRVIATIFMGFYFLFISAFVPLITLIVVWITDPKEEVIALGLALFFIAVLEVDFVKFATGIGYNGWIIRIVRAMKRWYLSRRLRAYDPNRQSLD